MKKIISLLYGLFCTINCYSYQKNVGYLQLKEILSRPVDAQALTDYIKPSSGFHRGLRVVNASAFTATHPPCSVDDVRKSNMLSGLTWNQYVETLNLIRRLKPTIMIDAASIWGSWDMTEHLNRARCMVQDIKAIDDKIVIQASPNEFVNTGMTYQTMIPDYVWVDFGLVVPSIKRTFNIFDMKLNVTQSQANSGIFPDISRIETQMFYYWLATQYIDMGYEAISFSALGGLGSSGISSIDGIRLVRMVKQYADKNANVRFVLITAHNNSGYVDSNNNLLFDFNTEPIRPSEDGNNSLYPNNVNGGSCSIKKDLSCPTIYQNTLGGMNPSGWLIAHNLGLVFYDNYLDNTTSPNLWGQIHSPAWNCFNPYHLDEISWFALQTKRYRDSWIRYSYNKVKCLDNNLSVAFPIKRNMAAGTNVAVMYSCDNGANFHNREWWPADYNAINPIQGIFNAPPTLNNISGGLVDRNKVNLQNGYGQENIILDVFDNGHNVNFSSWKNFNFTKKVAVKYGTVDMNKANSGIISTNSSLFYIDNDGAIMEYRKVANVDNSYQLLDTRAVHLQHYGTTFPYQIKAMPNSLTINQSKNKILFVGLDGLVYAIDININGSLMYSRFMQNEMQQQGLRVKNSLFFIDDNRAFYIAYEPNGSTRVHGFTFVNGAWSTVSPTHAATAFYNQALNSQVMASNCLAYLPNAQKLIYKGIDGLMYCYDIVNTWQFIYGTGPNSSLLAQNIRIAGTNFAVSGNIAYYVARELPTNAYRVHSITYINGVWNTNSPTHAAVGYAGQSLASQMQVQYQTNLIVSPSGSHITFTGQDNNLYYYDMHTYNWQYKLEAHPIGELPGNGLGYKNVNVHSTHDYSQNAIHYLDNHHMLYISSANGMINSNSDNNIHIVNYGPDYCKLANENVINNQDHSQLTSTYRKHIDVEYIDSSSKFSGSVLYPNPANDKIYIPETSDFTKIYSVIDGRGIDITSRVSIGQNYINISNLDPGMYILVYQIGHDRRAEKFNKY